MLILRSFRRFRKHLNSCVNILVYMIIKTKHQMEENKMNLDNDPMNEWVKQGKVHTILVDDFDHYKNLKEYHFEQKEIQLECEIDQLERDLKDKVKELKREIKEKKLELKNLEEPLEVDLINKWNKNISEERRRAKHFKIKLEFRNGNDTVKIEDYSGGQK